MKKIKLIFIAISISLTSFGQDTIMKSDYIRNGDNVFYQDTLFTGVAIEKAENGQMIVEEHYKNGLVDGLWKVWYATGEKKFEGGFVNGISDGVWIQ